MQATKSVAEGTPLKDCPPEYYTQMIDYVGSRFTGDPDGNRFVPLSSREMRSDIPGESWKMIQKGKETTHWNGVSMLKDPFAIAMYPMLLKELVPLTIVENGTYTGASAHWLATVAEAFHLPTRIYSMDYCPDFRDQSTDHPRVTYLRGDLNKPEEAWPKELLESLRHPVLMIEDAHTNMVNVLKWLEMSLFKPGDYVIVEDTFHVDGMYTRLNQFLGKNSENSKKPNGDAEKGWEKYAAVKEVFDNDKYLVDSKYCDMYGYNATYNWNTVFKVVK